MTQPFDQPQIRPRLVHRDPEISAVRNVSASRKSRCWRFVRRARHIAVRLAQGMQPSRSGLGGVAALLMCPGPALAWEFSPSPICTMRQADAGVEVVVTFDATTPEYAIALTLSEGAWPDAPVFALAFQGPSGLTISTDRHVLSPDGRTLSVTDRGFGNVLNGLEFNGTALAIAGPAQVPFSLEGAAPVVRAFRDCPAAVTS